MNDFWVNIIYTLVSAIFIPLISYAGVILSTYLKTKTENEKIRLYIEKATEAVTIAVSETSQTYVEELKRVGKFDEEAHRAAYEKSLATARVLITQDAKNAVQALYGDFDVWLNAQIEYNVNNLKK